MFHNGFAERHRQKAVTDGEHLMENQGRWVTTFPIKTDEYCHVFNFSPGRLPSTFPQIKLMVMEIMGNDYTGWIKWFHISLCLFITHWTFPGQIAWKWVTGEAGDLGHPLVAGGDHLGLRHNRWQKNMFVKCEKCSMDIYHLYCRCDLQTRSRMVELVMWVQEAWWEAKGGLKLTARNQSTLRGSWETLANQWIGPASHTFSLTWAG